MLGTLRGALEVRRIHIEPADMVATAEGTNELVDGIIRLTGIRVHYRLRIPAGSRETVDRALARHRDKCPTAQSLAHAIPVEWSAEVTEAG
jgi:uncharacterized OsmC-like protein